MTPLAYGVLRSMLMPVKLAKPSDCEALMPGRTYRGGTSGKANRQLAEACQGVLNSLAIETVRGRPRGLILARPPLAVGAQTPTVRVLNPDGSLREVLTAREMRDRANAAKTRKDKPWAI